MESENQGATTQKHVKPAAAKALQIVMVEMNESYTRKQIRRLRKGRGKLLSRVEDLLEEMMEKGIVQHTVQPVIIVLREKDESSIEALIE